MKRPISNVTTQKGLLSVLDGPSPRTIRLTAAFPIDRHITIPRNVELVPQQSGLIFRPGGSLQLDGELADSLQPCFYDAEPGQVYGLFGGRPKRPERWMPADKRDCTAIRCAVDSTPFRPGLPNNHGTGHTVLLSPRVYELHTNISCEGKQTRLVGAGGLCTKLHTMPGWTPQKWHHAPRWDTDHACILGFGGKRMQEYCYHQEASGFSLNCYYASISNPTRRVSGLGGISGCEEPSEFFDIGVGWASGIGIGWTPHTHPDGGVQNIASCNGVRVRRFWINGPMLPDSYAFVIPEHANNCHFSDFTVDVAALPQSHSRDYASGGFMRPGYIQHPMRIAADISGINNSVVGGHWEGPIVAMRVQRGGGAASVVIDRHDFNHMSGGDSQYRDDGRIFHPEYNPSSKTYTRPFDRYAYDRSCGVFITSPWGGVDVLSTVQVENLTSTHIDLLLQDPATGVRVDAFGQSHQPWIPAGRLRRYSRRDLWTGTGWFDPQNPATDRQYYQLLV